MQNRRQFTRVLFSLQAILTIGEREFEAKILDISLNGALINLVLILIVFVYYVA